MSQENNERKSTLIDVSQPSHENALLQGLWVAGGILVGRYFSRGFCDIVLHGGGFATAAKSMIKAIRKGSSHAI